MAPDLKRPPETHETSLGYQGPGGLYDTYAAKQIQRSEKYRDWSVTESLEVEHHEDSAQEKDYRGDNISLNPNLESRGDSEHTGVLGGGSARLLSMENLRYQVTHDVVQTKCFEETTQDCVVAGRLYEIASNAIRDNTATPNNPAKNIQTEHIAMDTQLHRPVQGEIFEKAVALFDIQSENNYEPTIMEGQILDISYRHGQGLLVAEDPKTKNRGLIQERYVCMLETLAHGIDSGDIEEKLTRLATDLAEGILEKSQWFDRLHGNELESAITTLGNEVRGKLHGQGWPRTTLELHREVHMKAFRDLVAYNRKQYLGPSNYPPAQSTRNETNTIQPHPSLSMNEVGIPDDESDDSFEFSATESVVSVADSIFSARSLATGSSLSSLSASQTATDRLVHLLLDDTVIKPLCENALRETMMSRERFERNLSRLLKGFAVELRKEAQTREERQTAHLVRFRAGNSAHMICRTLNTERGGKISATGTDISTLPVVEPQDTEGDLDMDVDSESASESSEDTPDFQHLENFARESKAFESFREKLRTFIHPQKALPIVAVSASTPSSRRNSLSFNEQNNLATGLSEMFGDIDKLPEVVEDIKEKNFITSTDIRDSTEIFFRQSPFIQWVFNIPTLTRQSNAVQNLFQTSQNLKLLGTAMWKRPPMASKKTRIEWHCKCGHKIWDDFTEVRPGAASRLKQALINHESGNTNTGRSSNSSGCSRYFSSSLSSLFTFWSSNIPSKGLESGLPTHEPPKNQLHPNNPKAAEPTPFPWELLYLLLCYPSGRYATRLLQLDLHQLEPMSDQSLFIILCSNYKSMRGRLFSLVSLKTLRSIKFIHFEMYRSFLIDVRQKDVIPPPGHIEYCYSPAPPEVIPPIGHNHLMHLFLNPSHADDDTVCLDRFPKKLKEKLSCKKGQATSFGWGLEFVEGWDMKSIWVIAFIIFGLGSLILGILWSVYKHSIQDAFAISGYMVSFAGISVGPVQSLLVM